MLVRAEPRNVQRCACNCRTRNWSHCSAVRDRPIYCTLISTRMTPPGCPGPIGSLQTTLSGPLLNAECASSGSSLRSMLSWSTPESPYAVWRCCKSTSSVVKSRCPFRQAPRAGRSTPFLHTTAPTSPHVVTSYGFENGWSRKAQIQRAGSIHSSSTSATYVE